jgi:hypothetical protein
MPGHPPRSADEIYLVGRLPCWADDEAITARFSMPSGRIINVCRRDVFDKAVRAAGRVITERLDSVRPAHWVAAQMSQARKPEVA